MEILYYFKEKDTLMDKWQSYHIFNELAQHNCKVTVFNPLNYENIQVSNEMLLKHLNTKKYDLFMTPHGSKDIYIETIKRIKEISIPTLLICFDNLIVPFNHKDIAKYFDLVWLTSKETEEMFKKWGANTLFNPYAANPSIFSRSYETEILNVAFIGTPYGSRVNMLMSLIKNDINVDLYANKTNHTIGKVQKHVVNDFLIPMYNLSRFKIGRRVLLGAMLQKFKNSATLDFENKNISHYDPVTLDRLGNLYSIYALSLSSTVARNTGILKRPVNIVNLRSFEIPMSAGLQICEYNAELASYFEEDKEIIFYRSNEELIEKSKFYLKEENKGIRMRMKEEARKRAESEHTWYERFKKIFDNFGII